MTANTWGQSPSVGAIATTLLLLLAACSSAPVSDNSEDAVSVVQVDVQPPEDVSLYVLDDEGRTVRVSTENRVINDLKVGSAAVSIDSSGAWVAYADFRLTGNGKTVYAGPSGGPYEPIATGISSFRWHEDRPGLLALQQRRLGPNDGQRVIQIADFNAAPPTLSDPQIVETDGALQRYGDWGFAFDLGGSVYQSTIVGPDGEAVARRVDGFASPLGKDELLLIGYVAEARLLSTETGQTREIDWFSVGDTVMESTVLSSGAVAFAMSNSFNTARRLMIVDQSGAVFDIEVSGLIPVIASSSLGPWPITIRRSGLNGIVERWRPSADLSGSPGSYKPHEIGRIDSLDLTTARPLLMLSVAG